LALSLAALPMAAYVQNRPRRHLVALVGAFAWGAATLFTGFVSGLIGLLVVLLIDGMSTGSVQSVHQPLVMDSYPPAVRVRALSFYGGANVLTGVIGPLLVAGLTGILLFSWRGVFLVMGLVSLAACFTAIRLKDPGFGRWDTGRIRKLVRGEDASEQPSELEEKTRLGFFEIVRRILLIPSLRRIFLALIVVGIMFIPFNTFFFFYLDERWGMGPGARGLFQAFLQGIQILVLFVSAKRLEQMFRADPARLVRAASWLLFAVIVFISIGVFSPTFAAMVGIFTLVFALIGILTPVFAVSILSLVPGTMRPHASALIGIYLAVGGIAGSVLLGGIDTRFGAAGAILAVALPGAIGGLIARGAASTVNTDLDRMIDQIVEEEELNQLKVNGQHVPLLACRNIDFSYGQVQV
ncbi:MAG: MFS transporter, partial [Actinobacteria bacterium]|nr:MFS transporter [Actinomycetota bacterium]